MIKRLKRILALLLVCTFLVSAYVAWSGITGREPVPIPDALGGGPKQVTGTDPDFGELDVDRGEDGLFAGSISVENSTDGFQDVIVTVDLFDGVNRPGMSGDSVPWEGWSHVRENLYEVPGRAA